MSLKKLGLGERKETGRPAITVDKDGTWYFQGSKIVRKDILSLFYENLHLDEDGYCIETEGEREFLEVEDTIFLVEGVEKVTYGEEAFLIGLNDGTQEKMDLYSLRIAEGNVPYCLVKEGRFPARFLRHSYYQLARYVQFDEETGEHFILLNDRRFPLQQTI